MSTAIRIENVGKMYQVDRLAPRGGSSYGTLRDDLVKLIKAPLRKLRGVANDRREDFWALKDVSFDVNPGDVVGLIGRNGAGKSTLLKILSRITKPTTGRIGVKGRVGSLLEVGTGFHPELTGRENIFLNGTILGMSHAEIQRKFDAIVDFSEIEKFLDLPVKRYSSGMYVRLAFGVAAHLEPEIMIIDEVLAVGDAAFQRKCLGKMHSLSEGGRTVIFVSHNMPAIRSITNRCVYLKGGRVVSQGDTPTIIEHYLQDAWTGWQGGDEENVEYYRRDKNPGRPVSVRSIRARRGDEFTDEATFNSGEDVILQCGVDATREFRSIHMSYWITNQQGERVATFTNSDAGFKVDLEPGFQTFNCRIKGLPFSPGRYTISLGLNQSHETTAYDVIVDYPLFNIVMPELESGEIEWGHRPWGGVHWRNVEWSRSV